MIEKNIATWFIFLQAFKEIEKINILTMGRRHFFKSKTMIFLAMFTVKNRLPYKSDVKGDNKSWLHKCFQTSSTIYLNKKGSHDSQFNKIR
jgi:hypothetical protein